MIEAIFEVKSPIEGAPRRFVGLDDETGRFGLCQTLAISPGKLGFVGEPMGLAEAIKLAGLVLAGDKRAMTDPLSLRRMAIAFLAASAKVGKLAGDVEASAADIEGLKQALGLAREVVLGCSAMEQALPRWALAKAALDDILGPAPWG